MDKLKNILIQYNYLQQDDLYIKNKKAYVSHIELTEVDDKYVSFVLKRIYKNKVIELANEKRKKTKFINVIEKVINDESTLLINDPDLFHCEISCRQCEETIINKINSYLFCNIKGFVCIHGIQYGMCIVVIDKETTKSIIEYLNTIKNCPECVVGVV